MNLPRIFRTSNFRLTLIYAGFTGASFLVLYAVVMWSATRFMQHQIDLTVAAEVNEVRTSAGSDDAGALARVIDKSMKEDGGFFYLLQDRSGIVRAGDLPAMTPGPGVRDLDGRADNSPRRFELRGQGQSTSDGGYLFVGTNAHEVHELRESLSRSFLLGLAVATVLVLVGGSWMSLSVLRRVETMSRASRDIVSDGLDRRIALNGSGDEFDHLAGSLNAMFDRIRALMEDLRQVSSDIAHDLRTPLTRLRQRLELAQSQPLDAPVLQAAMTATITDIDAILATFSALLRIAQVEGGAGKAHFSSVDLSDLLNTVIEVYQPSLEDKSQHCEVFVPAGLQVQGDRELLTQMFANLMENAHLHSPPGANLSVGAYTSEKGVVVFLIDDGPGIPEVMREKVLQRFVRLDRSRTTPGNGLGLALVAAIARLHGADLRLGDNAPGLAVQVTFRS